MKPIVKYRGGKSREIPHIEKHIPSFSGRYVEPFFGGGALYFYLEPKKAIINDINSKLMAFYSGVKQGFEALQKELSEIENLYVANHKKFEALKSRTPLTENLYGDMIIVEYEKSYAVNIRNRFKSTATHVLISNYTIEG